MTGRQKRAFAILHEAGLCKRCGICVAFCPGQCLAQDEVGAVVVVDEGRCTGCRLCSIRCPDMAIEIVEKTGST